MRLRRPVTLIFVIATQYLYYLYVMNNSTAFNDGWPLEGILIGFLAWLILTILGSLTAFSRSTSATVFSIILISSGIIFTPIFKYLNDTYLYNSWDSLAHYNYVKWIFEHGFIPSEGLVYSETYKLHPANGILPVMLARLSAISSLGVTMAIFMLFSYMVYTLSVSLYIAHKIRSNMKTFFDKIIHFSAFSFLFFYSFYCGSAISYGMIGLIIYLILRGTERSVYRTGDLSTLLILFVGLWTTHISSTALIVVFISLSFILKKIFEQKNTALGFLYMIVALLNIVFIFLQVFVDVIVTKNLLITAANVIKSLTSRELYIYRETQITIIDAVRGVLASHFKHVVVLLVSISIVTYFLPYRSLIQALLRRNIHGDPELVRHIPWLATSISLLIVGYLGTQEFVQGFRATTIIQWFLILYLVSLIKSFGVKMKRVLSEDTGGSLAIALLMIISLTNISLNYGIPHFAPFVTYEDGVISISTALPINDMTLNAYEYMRRFSEPALTVIGVEPYTTFALVDTLWTQRKILITKYLRDSRSATILINSITQSHNDIIIPMPLTYRLGYAKYLYERFYELPNEHLKRSCSIIYHNGYISVYFDP